MIMKFISSSTPLKGLCSTMKRQLISRWGLLFQQIKIWQSKGTKSCTKFKIFQMVPSNLASTHWSKAAPRFRKNVRTKENHIQSFWNCLHGGIPKRKINNFFRSNGQKNTFEWPKVFFPFSSCCLICMFISMWIPPRSRCQSSRFKD